VCGSPAWREERGEEEGRGHGERRNGRRATQLGREGTGEERKGAAAYPQRGVAEGREGLREWEKSSKGEE